MSSLNTVAITGNLVADPELRYTTQGKPVCNCTVAVNDGWGDNQRTYYIGVTVWGEASNNLVAFKHKGDPIAVQGRLTQEAWTDPATGKKQRKTHVTADRVIFLSRRDSAAPGPPAQS